MVYSESLWKNAPKPNYQDNVDQRYAYSEVPYLGQYDLVKIPISLDDLIQHVDYWGEGKAKGPKGIRGFSNCYNVNYTYKLVSYGADINHKIPNRIPVNSDTLVDTSAYLRDSSVLTVTVMGENISDSCAADIARIINNDNGVVIAYDYEPSSPDIAYLTKHLKNKDIHISSNIALHDRVPDITYNTQIIFANKSQLITQLYRSITTEDYSNAVDFTTNLDHSLREFVIKPVCDDILNGNSEHYNKLTSFAHQLWTKGGKNIVCSHLPESFKLLFDNDKVKIINKQYNQAMKLGEWTDDDGDRIAWGDNNINLKLGWKFNPIYTNNRVIFTIFNVDANMWLKSAIGKDGDGDRNTYGSKGCDTDRHRYIVEPFIKRGELCYHIINCEYRQGLKLALEVDSYGDRRVYGHSGDIYEDNERFEWIITKF